jgi:hypothetical protein
MMEPQVQIALIGMIGSVLSAAASAVAVYLGTVNKGKLTNVEAKVDGQLTEVLSLRDAVAYSKGQDQQRDKQELKKAVELGIKEHNGEPLH